MNLYEPTEEQLKDWNEWVASRPPNVRAVAEKLVPWKLYRMGSSGHRVCLYSYDEEMDGSVTLKVDVRGEFNFVVMERRVFGVKPEELTECEGPDPDEPVGSMDMSVEEAKALGRAIDSKNN